METTKPGAWIRRLVAALFWAGVLGAAGPAPAANADAPILIGQSAALTGPLGELGQEIQRGAQACLAQVNKQGGVLGKRLQLVTLDDAYDKARTEANVRRLVEQDGVFALLSVMGTPNNESVLPYIHARRVPYVAPFTGAVSVRKTGYDTVFHVRASYADEARKIVQHLVTVGIVKVSIVQQNNSFGRDVADGLAAALASAKLKPLALVTVENSAADAEGAAAKALEPNPTVVILATAGKATVEVIQAIQKQRRGTSMYALSVMGTRGAVKALGTDGVGVVVSQVMPFPWNTANPLVKTYQEAVGAQGVTEYSYLGLEGCLNALVLVEGLRRSGAHPTRERLVSALASMRQFELGGMLLGFGNRPYEASAYVELSIITNSGRFRR
jgi:branched-chain amino acid transport system substrate-binding protein